MTPPGTDGIPPIPAEPGSFPPLPDEYDAFERNGVLGRGGNATVYETTVRDESERVLALKEPHVPGDVPDEVVERFRTEAEIWAGIDDHPHVVTVHAWDTDPHPWIALEYMGAGTLAERAGECDLDQGLWIGACVASAVDHAHREGVVHLDLKPDNVLFRQSPGDAWAIPGVADWGMARFLRPGTANLEGLSPRYAAPEQFTPGPSRPKAHAVSRESTRDESCR